MRRLLAALALLGLVQPALGQEAPVRGVALVIGQSAYEQLAPLANPREDAREIDRLLGDLGFEVTRVLDADAEELGEELDEFADDARDADVAFVYYAGHGIEAGGENYLIPVDADISTAEAAGEKLVPLGSLLDRLEATVPITIFLLDACRTNSFPPGQLVQLPGADTPIAVSPEGLGETRGTVLTATTAATESLGVVIGFAAAPGRAALDGDPDGNSPYAAALLKHLGAGGYAFGDVMTMVAEEVYLETQARQLPWVNSSLRRFLSFGRPLPAGDADEELIRQGRRDLLLTIAAAPPRTRGFVESVASTEDVPLDALYGMLELLGVRGTTDETALEEQVRAGAERLRTLLSQQPGGVRTDAELIRLADLADRAEQEGAIAVALTFRERASARAAEMEAAVEASERSVEADRLQIGATYAEHARTAELSFDFGAAAGMWARAFAQVERWDAALALDYRRNQASALALLGEYGGDNAPLVQAIEIYEAAQGLVQPGSNDWANLENDRGNALLILGERESSPETLHAAVEAYEAVVEFRAHAGSGVSLGGPTSNLGVALMRLGSREFGTEALLAAVDAFETSLTHIDRASDPVTWARTMSNLGGVLLMLGDRERDPGRYAAAVEAHRAALEVLTREAGPLAWATAQNNLGQALARLGESGDPASLEAAIAAFRVALEERDRTRVPLEWAVSQDSLGGALTTLGQMTSNGALMEEGIAAFRLSLEEARRDTASLGWGRTQRNLAIALKTLGTARDDLGLLEEAADAYRAAIDAFDPAQVPMDWAQTNATLGIALMEIAARNPTEAVLVEAREAFSAALSVFGEVDPELADYLIGRIAQIDGALGY